MPRFLSKFLAKRRIYLDYASATPLHASALAEMQRAYSTFGNPGSIHSEGVEAKKLLQATRERIAMLLGVKARELVFVSGGTEANNLAILGAARRMIRSKGTLEGTHWITTTIEHPSTLECFAEIEILGGTVTHLSPDKSGSIRADALNAALRPESVFFSIAWANHETGVIQPVSALGEVLRKHERNAGSKVLYHVDAGQVPLYRATQPHSVDADLLSLDSGKLYGPRGVGVLFVSNRAELSAVMLGGGQERGLRAGTENVALAAGFAAAYEAIARIRHPESVRVEGLRNRLADELGRISPEAILNTDLSKSVPNVLNISFPAIKSEYMTLALDAAGIAVATKSACREGEESMSHVVRELGGPDWRAKNTIRMSLGIETSSQDIEKVVAEYERLLRNGPVI